MKSEFVLGPEESQYSPGGGGGQIVNGTRAQPRLNPALMIAEECLFIDVPVTPERVFDADTFKFLKQLFLGLAV